MEGLLCNIYRSGSDCSNGGISSKVEKVVLIADGLDAPFSPSDSAPAVKLVKRNIGGEYLSAEPADKPYDEIGYMFGGSFIYSSDSRFPSNYPIPLHDRCDSEELYNKLSR